MSVYPSPLRSPVAPTSCPAGASVSRTCCVMVVPLIIHTHSSLSLTCCQRMSTFASPLKSLRLPLAVGGGGAAVTVMVAAALLAAPQALLTRTQYVVVPGGVCVIDALVCPASG